MEAQDSTINTKTLKPNLGLDDVDVYLPRGIAALEEANANPRGLFRIFQRHEGARFFGLDEYLAALASLMTPEDIAETVVYAVPEGSTLAKHQTAMTIEGPATALMANETLLHYLSTGTRLRTLAANYPARKFPWVFMGARYLAIEDLAIATRALATEDILSTVPRWADKYIGTESHSQIAMAAGYRLSDEIEAVIADVTNDEKVAATIRATVAFANANPGVPLYVLGDVAARSVGCFETFRATREACLQLGIELVGGRMDISRADLGDEPIYDFEARNLAIKPGMSIEVVARTRQLLDEAGMEDFQLVVSSGIKLEEIKNYVEAGASIVGIGEEAAYYLNKGQCNFTSDAVGYFDGDLLIPFAKEGRELNRIVSEEALASARRGFKITEGLVQIDLANYA